MSLEADRRMGIYLVKTKNSKRYMHPYVYSSRIQKAKTRTNPNVRWQMSG